MERYWLNAETRTLTITKAFHQAMSDTSSPEYRLYKELIHDIPNLIVARKNHNSPAKSNRNKGLSYNKMEKFIEAIPNSEELKKQYLFLKKTAPNPYPAVVRWFKTQFPLYSKNTLYYLNNTVEVIHFDSVS